MTFTCILRSENTAIELRVSSGLTNSWQWCIRLLNGVILEKGVSKSRIAAQIAAQYGSEDRLRRAGLNPSPSDEFLWNQVWEE